MELPADGAELGLQVGELRPKNGGERDEDEVDVTRKARLVLAIQGTQEPLGAISGDSVAEALRRHEPDPRGLRLGVGADKKKEALGADARTRLLLQAHEVRAPGQALCPG